MSPKTESSVEDQCKELVTARFPEGLVRTLERKFPDGRHADYEDAVADGFVKLVAKGAPLENPRGYITTVAANAMRKTLARAARERLPEGEPDEDEDVDAWDDPTADEAINQTIVDFLRGIVQKWESRNVQTTTLLVLEAARLGEPISSAELAEELEHQLGEDVQPDTARQWRKRGLDRLREELHAADLWTEKELR